MEKLALLGRMAFTASMPIALGLVIVTMWDRGQEEFAEVNGAGNPFQGSGGWNPTWEGLPPRKCWGAAWEGG